MNRSIRVLHLVPALSSGGAERQLRYLVHALQIIGYDVHVAYLNDGPDLGIGTDWPANLHRLPPRGNHHPGLLLDIFRLIKKIQPDIVQTWLLQMDVAGGLAAMLDGRKWVLREPNVEAAYNGSWKFRLREIVARGCSAIVSNSQGGASYWQERFRTKLVRVIRNAIPYDDIQLAPRASLERFGCTPSTAAILYAGRLVSDHLSEKNLARLLRAIQIVNRSIDCSLILAGTGPQREALQHLARELHLEARTIFAGQLPPNEVWGLMKAARTFALVSPYEGMPNAVMEAAACGCPILLSDIPPHRELLPPTMAVFVDHEDAVAIAAGLIACIRDTTASAQRALDARDFASRWSISETVRHYELLYADLLGLGS
jgi:glycosyltransferase involved in cell wall biosynthesis